MLSIVFSLIIFLFVKRVTVYKRKEEYYGRHIKNQESAIRCYFDG